MFAKNASMPEVFTLENTDVLYVDGGVIKVNPSPYGGTWAVVVVRDGAEIVRASGLVTPSEWGVPVITNNQTELLAALRALNFCPNGWSGTLYTDSNVTRLRLTNPKAGMANLPSGLIADLRAQQRGLGKFKVVLLDGHPTKAHLSAGLGKRGYPVSPWNVLCDSLCGDEAEAFMAGKKNQ